MPLLSFLARSHSRDSSIDLPLHHLKECGDEAERYFFQLFQRSSHVSRLPYSRMPQQRTSLWRRVKGRNEEGEQEERSPKRAKNLTLTPGMLGLLL